MSVGGRHHSAVGVELERLLEAVHPLLLGLDAVGLQQEGALLPLDGARRRELEGARLRRGIA